MILRTVNVSNLPPIESISIENMGSMVVIAGANGSGKTRLKQAIIQTFQNPQSPQVTMTVQATRVGEEQGKWGSDTIMIGPGTGNPNFTSYMGSRTLGGAYTGTVIQVDSNRAVNNIMAPGFRTANRAGLS